MNLHYRTNARDATQVQVLKPDLYLSYTEKKNWVLAYAISAIFIPLSVLAMLIACCCIRSANSEYKRILAARVTAMPKLINASRRIISLNFLPGNVELGG